MKSDQSILDQIGHLRGRTLLLIKDPLVRLFPDELPKEEHNPSIFLLLNHGSCKADRGNPVFDILFLEWDEGRMKMTVWGHLVPHRLGEITFR
jgi:hypothetical protein